MVHANCKFLNPSLALPQPHKSYPGPTQSPSLTCPSPPPTFIQTHNPSRLVQAPRKFLTRTRTTVQRGFTQGWRCFPLYQSRLVLGVLIALVYGGTYSHLPYTFQGLQERLSLLFIVSAILPLLTLGALPIFAHNDKVLLLSTCCCYNAYACTHWRLALGPACSAAPYAASGAASIAACCVAASADADPACCSLRLALLLVFVTSQALCLEFCLGWSAMQVPGVGVIGCMHTWLL